MGAAAVEVLLTLVDTPWAAEERLDSDQAMTDRRHRRTDSAGGEDSAGDGAFTPRTGRRTS